MYSSNSSKAFTLVETLVVITILTVLFTATIVAINPIAQFRKANDTTRQAHTTEIQKAIQQYTIDNDGQPPASLNGTPMPTGIPGFEIAQSSLDICSKLVPQYMAELPVDPTLGVQPVKDCNSSYRTNYKAYYKSNNNTYVLSSVNPPYFYPAGMVGYWKMNDTSWIGDCLSPSVFDSSGNGNTGKVCSVSMNPANAPVLTNSGKFDKGVQFDASKEQYISVTNSPSLIFNGTDSMTLAGWFKTTASGGHLMAKHVTDGSAMNSYEIDIILGQATVIAKDEFGYGADGWPSVRTGLNDGQWHFVAYTLNRTTGLSSMYIDNVLDSSHIESPIPNGRMGIQTDLIIGGDLDNHFFNGTLDNIQIYKRDLTAAEISQIYKNGP